MNVSTITMDPQEARDRLKHYRAGVHRKADAEWERAAVAYEQLAQGTPLLVLSEAIQGAPCDVKGRPLLAVARADRNQVMLSFDGGSGRDVTYDSQAIPNRWSKFTELHLRFELTRPTPAGFSAWQATGYALVPMVPPNVLGTKQLRDHFILWDVKEWSDTRIGARPDRDPYLLRRVGDDLYAVVGEWDLTDVERAVMRDRARA